jgi:hypothetical protein
MTRDTLHRRQIPLLHKVCNRNMANASCTPYGKRLCGIGAVQFSKGSIVVDMAGCFMDNAPRLAGVMELVDVPDSKSGASDGVGVRVPPPAPYRKHYRQCQPNKDAARYRHRHGSVINVY